MKNNRSILLLFVTVLINTLAANSFAQNSNSSLDTALNNLALPSWYKTSLQDAIPHYTKIGKGKQNLILIPGLGFDETVFSDFINANKNRYTLYCITIPGYGKTQAPPTPPQGTSFGEQSWNKSLLNGLCKLIDKEKLNKPIIIGHFVQGTQLALRMAIDHPDKVGGVIILGGPAKFVLISQGKPIEYPLQPTIKYIDTSTAPNWFGTIGKRDFDDGNYLPEIYSLDASIAAKLWYQAASVPLPVMVRYLCEFLASDITLELDKINCPVLVLRAMFNKKVLQNPTNNYVQPQFIDSWNKALSRNSLIKVIDIQGAAACVWKDKPFEVYAEINSFINNTLITTNQNKSKWKSQE